MTSVNVFMHDSKTTDATIGSDKVIVQVPQGYSNMSVPN